MNSINCRQPSGMLALMGFFFMGPTVLMSLIAEALVDHWSRKHVSLRHWDARSRAYSPAYIINGSNLAIWQSKVPPDVQGRVFAVRRLIAQVTSPLGVLIAGPLADFVFEPAMRFQSALAVLFGSFGREMSHWQ